MKPASVTRWDAFTSCALVAFMSVCLAHSSRAADHGAMFEGPLGIPDSRVASGTAWQPDATPMNAVHFMTDDWMFMVHGLLFAGYDLQTTRRGEDRLFSTNWGMLMAETPL